MSYLFRYYYSQYDKFMSIFKLYKNNEITNVLGNVSDLNILDIGGGTGTLANRLIKITGRCLYKRNANYRRNRKACKIS